MKRIVHIEFRMMAKFEVEAAESDEAAIRTAQDPEHLGRVVREIERVSGEIPGLWPAESVYDPEQPETLALVDYEDDPDHERSQWYQFRDDLNAWVPDRRGPTPAGKKEK